LKQSITAASEAEFTASIEAEFTGVMDIAAVMDITAMDTAARQSAQQSSAVRPWARQCLLPIAG
jgi:hypothetical protein